MNDLDQATYIEPYAGGAAVALHLLLETNLPQIIINDIDQAIYSFWSVVKDNPEELCRRISKVRIDMAEWQKTKNLFKLPRILAVSISLSRLFFMNRTNRSGVLLGGVHWRQRPTRSMENVSTFQQRNINCKNRCNKCQV